MSISTKTVRGNKYLVFQWYQNGVQRFEYLGREDSVEAWEKAWKRLKVYHFERLEEFYSRMPQPVRDKLPLYHDLKLQVEERYRLLEAVKPQIEPRKFEEADRLSRGIESLLAESVPLQVFDPHEIKTLREAKRILKMGKKKGRKK